MARPLRIEYPGAFYHVTARCNERKDIFRDETVRERFLAYLESAVVKYKAVIHAYCLMNDGDQAVIETNRGLVRMKVRIDERVAEGVVLVPHGWPGEANANLLTDTECREPIMGYPQVKALLCSIRNVH
jgi:predicted molibdopterin-dependent oxidoreductase YjgC